MAGWVDPVGTRDEDRVQEGLKLRRREAAGLPLSIGVKMVSREKEEVPLLPLPKELRRL